MAERRRYTARRGAVHVVDLPHSVLVADVTAEVGRSGLTLETFIELGRADKLEDDQLRDLWLMAGPALG